MSKADFQVEKATSLTVIPKGGRVHLIGVSGTAMAPLAVLLQDLGYQVSGSDKEFFEPMGSLLAQSKIELHRGYSASNLSNEIELVVIGNAVSYENPEVSAVEKLELKYTFSAKMLYDLLIEGTTALVVTGTHGKSTTTSLLATALSELGSNPNFFIAALPKKRPIGLVRGGGKFSAIEGDEYDSAFFAKTPKFNFYKPHSVIVTGIEFDHADIYPDLHSILNEFRTLLMNLPADGHAICCMDCPNLTELINNLPSQLQKRIVSYGTNKSSDFVLERVEQNGMTSKVYYSNDNRQHSFDLPMLGEHNAKNALATIALLNCFEFDQVQIASALVSYTGLRRRQDIRFDQDDILVIDDFAHHPSAVYETLRAIRSAFRDRRIIAVFEPRSNTSRRKVFQQEYVRAFASADQVILCDVEIRSLDVGLDLLDVKALAEDISKSGVQTQAFSEPSKIYEKLQVLVKPNDVVVVMSNGAFGGLVEKLVSGLASRGAS